MTGEVLDEVPVVDGVEVEQDRHVFSAIWKEDFELAARTYPAAVSVGDALAVLGDDFQINSFESGSFAGKGVRAKTCCGDYDAVIVKTAVGDDGRVVQTMTVFDSDIQSAYALVLIVGFAIALAGGSLLVAASTKPSVTLENEDLDDWVGV